MKKIHIDLCIPPFIFLDANLEHKGDEEEGKKNNSSADKANVEVQFKIWLLFLRSLNSVLLCPRHSFEIANIDIAYNIYHCNLRPR